MPTGPLLQNRTLVFQPRPGLGDLIWHLPIIRAIAGRTQSGRVTLVTKQSTQADALLRNDPAIDNIVWFERNPRGRAGRHDGPVGFPRLVATLRECRAETGVLLHHGTSLAAAMRLAGIRHRVGYGFTAAQRFWLNNDNYPPAPAPFTEAFEQAESFAKSLGFFSLPEPSITVERQAVDIVHTRLTGLPRPWIALGIGSNGAIRQWGAAKFASLAGQLLQQGPGTIILLAASHEAGVAETIRSETTQPDRVEVAAGCPLPQVAALLSEADLFIGNDSGLMNLRAAIGRPAFGLFGASGPLRHSAMIRAIVPPGGARAGMDAITVEQVVGACA